MDYRVIPRAVFTEPALASVGLTESEDCELGYEVKVGTTLFADSGRAQALGHAGGVLKIILTAEKDEILGAWKDELDI